MFIKLFIDRRLCDISTKPRLFTGNLQYLDEVVIYTRVLISFHFILCTATPCRYTI